ncbi:aspartate/glutamate racemase family protein [Streptomyces sp. 6-11-2]|uniref:aspartate/glutamate racemase family protein n=1 Tax=Streptomyces sp. 6-11-2 TaxID=2585753 RepID=UPI00114147C3|nr:aspartate/glutamate racemase family protein [Streptomyces sp. 6-11-2]GED90846.1 hydantoin racemase [Streptomyces sp. 6-11-2]
MTPSAPTVLLVNPNSNRDTTLMMTDLIRPRLAAAGLEVEGVTAEHGPRMLVDPEALAASAPHVVDVVRRRLEADDDGQFAAVVVAAIGDPGRDQLEKVLDLPVVGIGQASIAEAARGGRRFGMATSTPLLVDSLTSLVGRYGAADAFTGVRLTESDPLVLAADPERQLQELAEAVRVSIADGAEAVIIAGGPLGETARRLAALDLAPIIETLPSAAAFLVDVLGAPSSSAS